jgi:hypothetical protein
MKLTYRNNWEADEYYVGKNRVIDLREVRINGKSYDVMSATVSVPYGDMGHTYTGRSKHYFVTEQVFGVDQQFDLNTVIRDVDVYAVKFTAKHKDSVEEYNVGD